MSEIWMYGPDYADDDDFSTEEEDEFYDDFEIPLPIIATPSPLGSLETGIEKKPQRMDIKITLKKIEVR